MQRVWAGDYEKDDVFNEAQAKTVEAWRAKSAAVTLMRPISEKEVPTRRMGSKVETIPADHGSFDNNLNVVNGAIELILGQPPLTPVTDLKGI